MGNGTESIVEINEKLYDIYGTWTAVIAVIFILITVIGFAVPLYNSKKIDKKIKKAIKKLKKKNDEINQRQIFVNNALMLSASGDYFSSNKILNNIIKTDENNCYLHLLIGRNIFCQYESIDLNRELTQEEAKEIEKAVEHYIFVGNNIGKELEYYELGAVFPDNIIHELCILINRLIEYSINQPYTPCYHKLTVKVIKIIEKILDINEFDDIVNEDQTNVFIMNYKLFLGKKLYTFWKYQGKGTV